MTILLILGWIACWIAAYIMYRDDYRATGEFTVRHRFIGFVYFVVAPVFLLFAIAVRIFDLRDMDKPAKW